MERWQFRFFGRVELLDPAGFEISLPTRKSEVPVAVLAINREHGLRRDELANILWPGTPAEKQRESLRQALKYVRKALGPHNLETTGTIVALPTHFR